MFDMGCCQETTLSLLMAVILVEGEEGAGEEETVKDKAAVLDGDEEHTPRLISPCLTPAPGQRLEDSGGRVDFQLPGAFDLPNSVGR